VIVSIFTKRLKVVIVEPLGEINIGSVARLCRNFEVDELRIVSPRCDPKHPDAIRMAVHGRKFLEDASIYSNLLDAIKDCVRVVATCGRTDHGEIPLQTSNSALQWLISEKSSKPIALVFGREDRGLTNSELQMAQKVISLNASPTYPSLNLSHAVAVILHELNSFSVTSSYRDKKNKTYELASPKELNDCIEDTKELLLEIGFLQDHTAKARMAKIKSFLNRAEARKEDIYITRGILRQIRWFSKNKNL
tara:strand:+ start:389 stop:1138 length:750 start_codon:yes stop_codon:yes gene_type:complete